MSWKKNEAHYLLLSCLAGADSPLGAGFLLDLARRGGLEISEATIGRALRDLRGEGLLEKSGNKGHFITEQGKELFLEMKRERELYRILKDFPEGAGCNGLEDLVGVLIARKALEREAVTQATVNATEKELDEVADIVALQYEKMQSGDDYAEMSGNFHRAVFKVSHVPFLETVYNFIGMSTSWQRFFVDTFIIYDIPANLEHEKILEAMRGRDPEKAAALMTSHIDNVIQSVKRMNFEMKETNLSRAYLSK